MCGNEMENDEMATTLMERTTVQVYDDTKSELEEMKVRRETYDDVIRRLMDFYKQNNQNQMESNNE
jgi:predicted CopG family antitoxin